MAMTEEEKKAAAAERARAARAKKKAEAEAKAKEEAGKAEEATAVNPEIEALKAQNEALQKQLQDVMAMMSQQTPTVVRVATDTERVRFLWIAPVADYNEVLFGENGMYGRITGPVGTFSVPKSELSRVIDNQKRLFLERRWLIIVDGLSDDEKEALGVDYKRGEVLDRHSFLKITELGDEILDLYPALCDSHKKMVALRYYEAHQNGKEFPRERIEELQKMTAKAGLDIQNFKAILQDMNDKIING